MNENARGDLVLRGAMTALVTPFQEDGTLDPVALDGLVRCQAARQQFAYPGVNDRIVLGPIDTCRSGRLRDERHGAPIIEFGINGRAATNGKAKRDRHRATELS